MPETDSEFDPKSKAKPSPSRRPGLIRRTWRRRNVPILTRWALLTVALMSAAYVLPAGPYRSNSLLRVDPATTDLYGVKAGVESLEAYIQTQVQLITSPNILTAAGTNPKATALPRIAGASDVVQELRKAVKVAVVPNTYLIEVSVESMSAAESATLVNAVVDAYMEAASEWSDGMTRVQIRNLEAYHVELRNQTDDLERKWKTLVAKGDLDQKARQANLIGPDQAAKIEEKLIENDLNRLEVQAQLDVLRDRPVKDTTKLEELQTRVDVANRLETAINARRASGGFEPKNPKTDAVEITLIQDERETLKAMQVAVIRRLEQLRYEAKGEARIRPVNPTGAMVPGKPYYDRRPLLMSIIPFATFAVVFSFFAAVEAWSGSKRVRVETNDLRDKP